MSEQDAYHELSLYTLQHPDPIFIHQYVVDAYTAQTATEATKPITLVFALVGLYLHLEKHFSGRDVQLAHMRMAKKGTVWPVLPLPESRGTITVSDVLRAAPGHERDELITRWSQSVWEAWSGSRKEIIEIAASSAL